MKTLWIHLLLGICLFITTSSHAVEKATKDECMSMCKKAVALAQEKGAEEMITKVADPGGPFIWKDTYLYVINLDSKFVVAHPIRPNLINRDMSGLKDINGKMFFVEMFNIALDKGEGWLDYMWPKPGEKMPSSKSTYVLRVPGQPYAVMSGIYND